jgi:hypothetical protein
MIDMAESLHMRVKTKLVKTLSEGLPKEWGRPTLTLKNGKKVIINKVYGKYVVECGNLKSNNMSLDELTNFIIQEGK